MLANDDVKQDHAGVFTFDPISRIEEWRAAMLADPFHIKKFSNDDAIAIRRKFFAQREALEVKGTQVSGWGGDQDLCENRCPYRTYRN